MKKELKWALPLLMNQVDTDLYKDIDVFNQIHQTISAGQFLFTDRSKTITMPFDFYHDEKYKIPKFKTVTYTFEEACIKSAISIANTDKRIYLFWSGGIDSTAMVVAFLLANINKKQITVVFNNDSIQEYFLFYKHVILPNFDIVSLDFLMQESKFNLTAGIFVEANPADYTFGDININSIISNFGNNFALANASRENIIKLVKTLYNVTDYIAEIFFNLINSTIDQSPRKIETIFDFWWWVGYNFKWESVNQLLLPRLSAVADTRFFFNEIDMQLWTLNNLEPIMIPFSYKKKYLKKMIFDYTKDALYYESKIKWPSVSRKFLNQSAILIDQDNNFYYNNANILDFYNQNNIIKTIM